MDSLKKVLKKSDLRDGIFDVFLFILGAAIYSFSFVYFIEPHKISPGGLTGISAIINYLFPVIPVGMILFTLNIPVIILGFYKVGGRFIIKTLFVTAIISFFIDLFSNIISPYKGERLIAALFGGVLIGFGLALVMLRGGTTGGTDVLAKIMRIKFPFFSMGRMVLALDGLVVIFAAITYKNLETALYSVVTLFASAKMLDAVLYGSDTGKFLFIVTNKSESVSAAIFDAINRGVTIIPAKGGYKNEHRTLLLCALRNVEVDKAIKTVKSADDTAFTVVTVTGGVFGRGFEKKYDM